MVKKEGDDKKEVGRTFAEIISTESGITITPADFESTPSTVKQAMAELYQRLITQRDISGRDPLTKIHNRRALEEQLDTMLQLRHPPADKGKIKRRKRHEYPDTAIIMFDLDDFGEVNKKYGHTAGDLVLKHTTRIVEKTLRPTDYFARRSGDEFVVIMRDTTEKEARARMHDVLETLRATPFIYEDRSQKKKPIKGTAIPVSMSCAVTQMRDGDDRQSMERRLDAELQNRKTARRERKAADAKTVIIPRADVLPPQGSHRNNVQEKRSNDNKDRGRGTS